MYCCKCGKELDPSFNCCPYCGNDINGVREEKNEKINKMEDSNSGWWAVLGFFVPLAGLILYLVWENEKPLTAKKCGKGALISVITGVSISVLFTIIMAIIFIVEIVTYSSVMTIF